MRLLFGSIVALMIGATAALVVQEDAGYVMIGYGRWTVESSLALVLVLILVLFVLSYLFLRLLTVIAGAPGRMRNWARQRSARRARRALNRGLVELSEGRWEGAEKSLLRYAGHSETPLLNYLAAARSAQKQGAHERRDHYLQLAHESMPSADVAVGLTQAELQMAHEQLEQALATLRHLRTIAPKHTYVLKLLKSLYERLEDWEQLRELLPELRKRKVVSEQELRALESTIYRGLLDRAASSSDSKKLAQAWGAMPRSLRTDDSLVEHYAKHLIVRGENDQAESLLRDLLRRNWSETLVDLYGRIERVDPGRQLASAEEWLGKYPHSSALLLALGRLSLRSRLWGKARSYLEASIGIKPTPAAHLELGALLEQMESAEKAKDCFRAGLELSAQETVPTLPAIEGQVIKAERQPPEPLADSKTGTEEHPVEVEAQ